MKSLLAAATIVSALMLPGAALADAQYDKCIDQSEDTNSAWGECGGDWIEREDVELNRTWSKLNKQVSDQTKQDLLAEQRLWNHFKEASCQFYANGEWGREGEVLSFATCRAGVIAARTQELQDYLEATSSK